MFRMIKRQWERICRMAYWAWHMRDNHDWDYAYLLHMIHLKLSRMEKEMLHKGNAVWQHDPKCRTYRSLKEAKELAKRLSDDSDFYHYNSYRVMDKYTFSQEKLSTQLITNPPKEFSKEFKIAVKKDKEIYDFQRNRFFDIMNRYGSSWWD